MKLHPLFVADPALTIQARILRIDEPLSFWGGVDPNSGRLGEPPFGGVGEVGGRMVCVRQPRGSSSSSAVLLQLIYCGRAPAALILGEPDAILGLGAIVAREMGWRPPPIYALHPDAIASLPQGAAASINGGDLIVFDEGAS